MLWIKSFFAPSLSNFDNKFFTSLELRLYFEDASSFLINLKFSNLLIIFGNKYIVTDNNERTIVIALTFNKVYANKVACIKLNAIKSKPFWSINNF